MVQLTELPDDILNTILLNFKLSGQNSPYLRRADEAHYRRELDDSAKRADLAVLARVSKAFCRLASPLLYESRYLHLNMRTSRPYRLEELLGQLSSSRHLHHLICKLWNDRVDSFLICLVNAATSETLRGLCVRLRGGDDTGRIDLRRLSRLPQLLGLELRFDDCYRRAHELLVPPPASLPSLKEFHITATYTFAQTASVLSIASPSSLEILGLYDNPLEGAAGSPDLWARTLNGNRFSCVHTLTIALQCHKDLPAELLAAIPSCFPCLRTFNLECQPRETDYHKFFAKDLITSLTISTSGVRALKALLISITNTFRPNPRLRAMRIELCNISLDDTAWGDTSVPDIIQLSRDARSIVCSHDIDLRPVNLTGQMQERMLEQQERQNQNWQGWSD